MSADSFNCYYIENMHFEKIVSIKIRTFSVSIYLIFSSSQNNLYVIDYYPFATKYKIVIMVTGVYDFQTYHI